MFRPSQGLVQRAARDRSAASVLELVFVLPVVILILLGTIDISMLIYAYGTVAEAARAGARYAIVHGSASSSPAGPTANNAAVASAAQVYAPALNPASLTVTSNWPSGSNDPTRSVTVNVSYQYPLVTGRLFGCGPVTVSGSSTMIITH